VPETYPSLEQPRLTGLPRTCQGHRSPVSGHESLSPFPATHPRNSPITPFLATLPKSLDLKPFRCHTYETPRGCGNILLTRHATKYLYPERPSGVEGLLLQSGPGAKSIAPRSLRALFTLLHKSVNQTLPFQSFAHSFLKQPGVGGLFPFRFTSQADAESWDPTTSDLAPNASTFSSLSTVNSQLSTMPHQRRPLFSSTSHQSRVTSHETPVTSHPQ
jgi:hypothetical protein